MEQHELLPNMKTWKEDTQKTEDKQIIHTSGEGWVLKHDSMIAQNVEHLSSKPMVSSFILGPHKATYCVLGQDTNQLKQ